MPTEPVSKIVRGVIGQSRRVHAVHLLAVGTAEESYVDKLLIRTDRAASALEPHDGIARAAEIGRGQHQPMVGADEGIYEGTEMNGWYPDYFFHKGGMVNFTRFVAAYYGRWGIRCNCLSPGGLETPATPERTARGLKRCSFTARRCRSRTGSPARPSGSRQSSG